MRLQVKGKNVEVTPSIREYAERKLAKLGKQLAEQTQVEVELSEQRNPSIAASQVAEATVFTKGPTLRAREASPDMKASIDQLVDKLERQVKRYRERRTVEPRRHAEHNGVEPRGIDQRRVEGLGPDGRGVEGRAAEPRGGSD
jgi:putative sigma-54 modulation protein